MWSDAIVPLDRADCVADRGRSCRRRLFGDVAICVKCGEPRRQIDGTALTIEHGNGNDREAIRERWRREFAEDATIRAAELDSEIPF